MRPTEALFRTALQPLLATACRVLFGLRLERTRFVPARGAALIVANHQGYLDPLFLQMAVARPVRFMMTSDFYDLPGARPFFRLLGSIRVSEGGAKRDALKAALAALGRGELVGLFPEGRLSTTGDFSPVQPGVAYLAARSGAPVVPARIRGSIRVLPKGEWRIRQASVRVRFGPAMAFGDPRDATAPERILAAWESL